MEVTTQSLSHAKLPRPLSSPSQFQARPSFLPSGSVHFQSSRNLSSQLQSARIRSRKHGRFGAIVAASDQAQRTSGTDVAERWLLVPVGDGDSRHIGFKVKMPGAFEIASSEVTVGRLPEKADMVIPVATVSGVHARIQKKGESLLVTDLDSTNGTYVDDKRLRPGVVATVSPGSCITFGDIHLAMFRISRLESVEAASKPEESEEKVETDSPTETTESTS
ncbi:hypothetical protein HS088_TW07G00535 [Tripterygium wilfordii]|uniref:FHA domain-containing protein n=2 Tax=Tripterygium wilfordii TaxID=458696 RepID=A0A7J7DF84_TRIWF|nr:hypothetical protein HS088_TW07G00535 [Tripterygium wilfordii]